MICILFSIKINEVAILYPTDRERFRLKMKLAAMIYGDLTT